MKILGLSCSPRKQGSTTTLLNEALRGAQQEGAEIELYSVAGKNIKPCDGCGSCNKTSICRIDDDMQELFGKLLAADGIIFGTPVYFYGMTAQAKAIIDRTISFNSPEKSLANKVGGVVVPAGSLGIIDALKDLYFYMVTRQMIPANYVAVYPGGKGELPKMEKCMKATFELGQQMVQIAAKKWEYPKQFQRTHFGFGTHTR
jgi:multimeric flavodoxin WrbA